IQLEAAAVDHDVAGQAPERQLLEPRPREARDDQHDADRDQRAAHAHSPSSICSVASARRTAGRAAISSAQRRRAASPPAGTGRGHPQPTSTSKNRSATETASPNRYGPPRSSAASTTRNAAATRASADAFTLATPCTSVVCWSG